LASDENLVQFANVFSVSENSGGNQSITDLIIPVVAYGPTIQPFLVRQKRPKIQANKLSQPFVELIQH